MPRASYKVFLRYEAAQTLRNINKSQCYPISSFIDSLTTDPDQKGDYSEHDDTDRTIEIKIIKQFAISYWPDHPVQEVKIIDISRADQP